MVSKPAVHIINLPEFKDERGCLAFVEGDHHIPFEIRRVFFIYDVPEIAERAGHAHKTCQQVLIAVSGMVSVYIDGILWLLCKPNLGLYIPPGCRVNLRNFSDDCVLLVLASEHFDEEDYLNEARPILKSSAV